MTKIQTKIISHKKISNNYNNYLEIEISGDDINYIVMNTLRRTILELIPAYGFDPKNIIITNNTSIYNNDYMRLRLSLLPIFNIDNDISVLDKVLEYEKLSNTRTEESIDKINIINNFTIIINAVNNSKENINITTDSPEVSYLYKNKEIETPYKKNILLIKLKPNEVFKCSLVSTLNIPMNHIRYSTVAICVYSEIEANKFILNLESYKQITEKEIIIRGCLIIIKKLNDLCKTMKSKITNYIDNKYIDEFYFNDLETTIYDKSINLEGSMVLENESHTFGNLLTNLLQKHDNIKFAGYKVNNILIKELTIDYITDGTDILKIIDDINNKGVNIYSSIKDSINNIKLI